MSDTTKPSTPKTFTLGEIEVTACLFRTTDRTNVYVVGRNEMDYIEFINRYNSGDTKYVRVMGAFNIAGTEGKFFLFANQDCFDPPVYIVRADNESDAYDTFLDETDACLISEPDLADYLTKYDHPEGGQDQDYSDRVTFDSNGRPHDTESLVMWEVKLIGIETE